MGARILVVDDHAALREALSLLLESEGHIVSIASEGREALDAARRLRPDLILTDLDMPVMNGCELCCALLDAGIRSPVLFMSGDASVRARAVEYGAAGALIKPFSLDDLVALVEGTLRQAAA